MSLPRIYIMYTIGWLSNLALFPQYSINIMYMREWPSLRTMRNDLLISQIPWNRFIKRTPPEKISEIEESIVWCDFNYKRSWTKGSRSYAIIARDISLITLIGVTWISSISDIIRRTLLKIMYWDVNLILYDVAHSQNSSPWLSPHVS